MKDKIKISSFSVILAFVCLTLVGISLIPVLRVKLAPSQSLPQMNIFFQMNGSTSRVVEVEATSKLEAMLNRMNSVEEIKSTSGKGWGSIDVKFDKHANLDAARFEVSTIVRQTWPDLPSNVSYPTISIGQSDHNATRPFMSYTINAPVSPIEIQQYAEMQLKPCLAQMDGVYRIDVSGATPLEWHLEYDSDQLDNLGISVDQLETAVNDYLKKDFLGIGYIDTPMESKEWIRISLIQNDGQDAQSVADELASVGVVNKDGLLVSMGQLVKISRKEAEAQSYYRVNGLNSIYIRIYADDSANQLELNKLVKKELEVFSNNMPLNYELHLNYDATEYIHTELNRIYFKAGLTLAILLLFIFLIYRSWRYTFLIVCSLFVNISVAFIFYYLLHLEMQLYSLAGITISLTLIIDNAIVMSDQIVRQGNRKAFIPILTATLTTIISLSVIFFLDEKLRNNLQDFAIVIMVNLVISLFIALFLVPALIEKLNITTVNSQDVKKKNRTSSRAVRLNLWFNNLYSFLCKLFYRRRLLVVVVVLLIFGLPVFLLPDKIEDEGQSAKIYNRIFGTETYKDKIKPYVDRYLGGTLRLFVEEVYNGSYFVERGETTLYVTSSMPNNTTLQQMNELVSRMEAYLSNFSEIKQFQTNIENARQANIIIYFTKEHQKSDFPYELKARLISRSIQLGGGSWTVNGLGDGFSNEMRESAGSLQVEMLGFNYDELYKHAELFKEELMKNRRIGDVLINSEFTQYKDDYEEYVFDINKEKLADEHIEPYELYSALAHVFGGDLQLGYLVTNGGVEEIKLSPIQGRVYDIWHLQHIPLRLGDRIYKLSDLARIEKRQMPQNVSKINQQYRLCLQFGYIGSGTQGQFFAQQQVDNYQRFLPMGYTVKNVNELGWWRQNNNGKYWLLVLIFTAIYFMASILFNSLKQPFAIIFVIPISFIGIFLTFYLFHLNFDQGGFASFILLSGLTINANIYILNEYNNQRKNFRAISPLKAYIRAWNIKVRPVLLTILSTILGFIPFMIGTIKEAFWFPLAAGTIGGLIVAFIATFFFLPLFLGVGKNAKN